MQFSQTSSIDISDSTHPLTDESIPQADYISSDITNKYFVHFLGKSDTLQALALFYHVTLSMLKRINKLPNERMLYSRKYILIPKLPQNIHLEASIGTVIYPDPPPHSPLQSPVKMDTIRRSASVEPVIENHGWTTINTSPQYAESTHSESYLQKIESAALHWYTSPRQRSHTEDKDK